MLAGSKAITVRIRKKLGKHNIISTNRMIRVSMDRYPQIASINRRFIALSVVYDASR